MSASAALEGDYVAYLRRERGLSERSIQVYQPYVKDFIATWTARTGSDSPAALNAQIARSFLLDRIQGRSGEYARLLATVIRSYLRFVFLRGDTAVDLSLAVPTVRLPGHASPPSSFSPEEVEQILSSVDLSTAGGRRDHAILLLLARLGLRAGEVVGLELEDVHWRAAEIVIHGKGRTLDRLPLPSDVGEALSRYIREDRDPSATRRVFLRKIPPRVGLAGPAAVGHVVRAALARAGVQAPCRGAAHLFRHSLATRMIRQGGSLGEISQILRHRSSAVTEVYAKVAFESLRAVSRPWPGSEDGR